MNHVDIKSSIYIDFVIENNNKDSEFKVVNHIRISRYKIFLQNFTFLIGQKNFLRLKKLKILLHGHL